MVSESDGAFSARLYAGGIAPVWAVSFLVKTGASSVVVFTAHLPVPRLPASPYSSAQSCHPLMFTRRPSALGLALGVKTISNSFHWSSATRVTLTWVIALSPAIDSLTL